MILWLIGMSGSGKTTLGEKIYQARKARNKCTVFLDGDHVRDMLRGDADYTVQGRYKNAERISHLCKFLDKEGIDVVAAVLSIFPEWQKWNRENLKDYYEIFLDVPITELIERDPKGFYKKAAVGQLQNFVGFDIEFPRPPNPDLVITLDDMKYGIESTFNTIMKKI
ncbi:MAG: adenylyl-sulfate kinase [Pseudomonadota bacterium]|nr:adenylyl-sulfate kinase [Pseudomonadota bacterium]